MCGCDNFGSVCGQQTTTIDYDGMSVVMCPIHGVVDMDENYTLAELLYAREEREFYTIAADLDDMIYQEDEWENVGKYLPQ